MMELQDVTDPTMVARTAPSWLLDMRLADITNKGITALSRQGVHTVRELAELDILTLRSYRAMGPARLKSLCEAMERAMQAGPPTPAPTLVRVQYTHVDPSGEVRARWLSSFLEGLTSALATLPPRWQDVLTLRLGLAGRQATLQQIADHLRLTRERVRQVEQRALVSIQKLIDLRPALKRHLHTLLEKRETPLYIEAVDVEDPWFTGIAKYPELIPTLVETLLRGDMHIVSCGDDERILAPIGQDRINQIIQSCQETLQRFCSGDADWRESECKALVEAALHNIAPELAEVVWHRVRRSAHFYSDDSRDRRLVGYGNTAEAVVAAVMRASSTPLHYEDVPERAASWFGCKLDGRSVHNALQQTYLLYAPGTYGLLSHHPLNRDERIDLQTRVLSAMAEAPSRQWHSEDLLDVAADAPYRDRVTAHIIGTILRDCSEVISLGRMIWTMSVGDSISSAQRVDIHRAVESILISASGPMSSKLILERLRNDRGFARTTQIFPGGRIFRVSRGTWGLVDRDSGFVHAERCRRLDRLATVIEDRGAGIHVTELFDVFTDLTEDAATRLYGLAQVDPRFRTDASDHVYLSDWQHSRRIGVREAVNQIVANCGQGIGLRDLFERAREAVGRDFDVALVSSALQGIDAYYDEIARLWFPSNRDSGQPR